MWTTTYLELLFWWSKLALKCLLVKSQMLQKWENVKCDWKIVPLMKTADPTCGHFSPVQLLFLMIVDSLCLPFRSIQLCEKWVIIPPIPNLTLTKINNAFKARKTKAIKKAVSLKWPIFYTQACCTAIIPLCQYFTCPPTDIPLSKHVLKRPRYGVMQ